MHAQHSEKPRQWTCKERIGEHYRERMRTLRKLWRAQEKGRDSEEGRLSEYGLSFSYRVPENRRGRRGESYFCYLLSWGGPSDEFRFFASRDGRGWSVYRIEYRFMDWFDGAKLTPRGKNRELLENIFAWFNDVGTPEWAWQQEAG